MGRKGAPLENRMRDREGLPETLLPLKVQKSYSTGRDSDNYANTREVNCATREHSMPEMTRENV